MFNLCSRRYAAESARTSRNVCGNVAVSALAIYSIVVVIAVVVGIIVVDVGIIVSAVSLCVANVQSRQNMGAAKAWGNPFLDTKHRKSSKAAV